MGDETYPITIRVDEDRKDEWDDSKDELEMASMAEYVRAMVAAGQKQYNGIAEFEGSSGETIRQQIERELESDTYTGWEELVAALTDDLEVEIEDALEQMETSGRVVHSPREGGYRLNVE
jgi:hypothetical protein